MLCLAKRMAEDSISKTERQKKDGEREQKEKKAKADRLKAWLNGEGEDKDVIWPRED